MSVKQYNSIEELENALTQERAVQDAATVYKAFFVTFGGNRPFAKHYVGILAVDVDDARKAIFDSFNNKWSMIYPARELGRQINDFGLLPLCFLKSRRYGWYEDENLDVVLATDAEFFKVLEGE